MGYRYHPDDEPYPMRRMGFSHDPGPLPFVTLRRREWENRLMLGELIEIHGEHGCTMPPTAARVVGFRAYAGPIPAHLATVYAGQRLVMISLAAEPGWIKKGEDWLKIDPPPAPA